jgi:hypothetical protein
MAVVKASGWFVLGSDSPDLNWFYRISFKCGDCGHLNKKMTHETKHEEKLLRLRCRACGAASEVVPCR